MEINLNFLCILENLNSVCQKLSFLHNIMYTKIILFLIAYNYRLHKDLFRKKNTVGRVVKKVTRLLFRA